MTMHENDKRSKFNLAVGWGLIIFGVAMLAYAFGLL